MTGRCKIRDLFELVRRSEVSAPAITLSKVKAEGSFVRTAITPKIPYSARRLEVDACTSMPRRTSETKAATTANAPAVDGADQSGLAAAITTHGIKLVLNHVPFRRLTTLSISMREAAKIKE
jgi:hypothetical protein